MAQSSRKPAPPQHGAALVVALVLLIVATVLGMTGLLTAALDLQMSGNLQYQQRAFQAAEYAIEQALARPTLNTAFTLASPLLVANAVVPGSAPDIYDYRLYFDSSAGSTPLPGGAGPGPANVAYHFMVVGVGRSARGAASQHTQGFYVVGPAGCDSPGVSCDFATGLRRRTYWTTEGLE